MTTEVRGFLVHLHSGCQWVSLGVKHVHSASPGRQVLDHVAEVLGKKL